MMKLNAYPVLLGAAAMSAAAVIAGCNRGELRQANDAAAEVTAAWSKAFDSGNPAALVAIYAADAHSLPTGGVALTGREQIESYWRADIGEGGVTTTLTPTDAVAGGDLLHVQGTYQVNGAGEMELVRGQYQQLWARTNDGWQVKREMWRTDPALQRSIDVAERLTAAWTKAYNAGDAQALVAMYAKDGVLSTVQDGSFEGSTAIELFWTRDFGGSKPSSTLTLTDVYMSGDLAHLEGEYKVVEGKTETEGRFVQLWMRDGDAWRIHREMWLR
jgi:ketosteroid isomerase-like protein